MRGGLLVALALGVAAPGMAQESAVTETDSLRLRVEVPDTVATGAPVPVRLVVENTTEGTVALHLTGRPVAFDLEVVDPAGQVVWRRLEGEVVSMVLQLRTLASGHRLTFEAVWDQRTNAGRRVPPGVYRVRGLLPTDAREPLATSWVEFQIAG